MIIHDLRSVDPARNRRRWYTIQIQRCLFGGVDVVRRWGRIDRRGGGERRVHFQSEAEARRHADRVACVRHRHEYEPCGTTGR